jgi:hypothetical protein
MTSLSLPTCKLMRQLTVTVPNMYEIQQILDKRCPYVLKHITQQDKTPLDNELLFDFVFTVLETTAGIGMDVFKRDTYNDIQPIKMDHQMIMVNLIDEVLERGLLADMMSCDMSTGASWYGSLISTYFSNCELGRQVHEICKRRTRALSEEMVMAN